MSRNRVHGAARRRGLRSPCAIRLPGRPRFCRPFVELLEDRTLLAAAVAGNVFNDVNGNGIRDGAEPGLAGVPVFLDLNHDGRPDGADVAFTAAAPAGQSLPLGGDPLGFGVSAGPALAVSGLPDPAQHLRVGLDAVNDSPDTVLVALFSPLGQQEFNGPNLIFLAPGQHFAGTFDDQAAQRVGAAQANLPAGATLLTGTYQPENLLADPPSYVSQASPDGSWLLLLIDPNNGPVLPGFALHSWSLTFNVPEPSTVTDAAGNYAFTDLAPGGYDVTVSLPAADTATFPAGGPSRHVTLADGQSQAGVNFGAQAAADLAGTSFQVLTPPTDWGQPVTVRYTVANQGQGAAGPFEVDLRLAANGQIDAGSLQLGAVQVDGLAAGASGSDTLTVQLPGSPGNPPAGFGRLDGAFLGLLLDPGNAVAETSKANNANQGAGIDEAPLVAPQDQALTADPGVQQQPSVAVDPHDPDRVAVAYMDYSLLTTGYAGIAVASSADGGGTWQHTTVPLPAGFDQAAGYPSVRFDDQGRLFISFMAVKFLGPQPPLIYPRGTDPNNNNAEFTSYTFTANNGIFVARSDDGGATWGTPTAVVSHLYTGTPVRAENIPDLAVDTFRTLPDGTPNPNYGNVYVTWTRAYPPGQFPGDPTATGGSDVLFAVSTDGGQSFPAASRRRMTDPGNNGQVASGNGFDNFSHLTVGPQGDVYVSANMGGDFRVFHSFDGGNTFAVPDNSVGENHGIPFGNLSAFPDPTLRTNNFRTLPVRQLVADPTRPGVVYAVEAIKEQDFAAGGADIDAGSIQFARSNDYGQTWERIFTVGGNPSNLGDVPLGGVGLYHSVLNDDDGGRFLGFTPASALAQEVRGGQALPHLAVDEHGNLSVIWYDTRRDPANHDLDVFGTTSGDGGQTFRANFRLTSASFDANSGAFADAIGQADFFLGDATGLAMADGTAYAVWTDTRAGNQDIHFERFPVAPVPAPGGDRFEPNDSPAAATDLGGVSAQRVVPRLTLNPGDDDWYRVEPSSGTLTAATSGAAAGQRLLLELYDATGTRLLAVGSDVVNAAGQVTGETLDAATVPGQPYLLRVAGVPFSATAPADYSLVLQSLTGDLGTAADALTSGSLPRGGQAVYRLTAPVDGTLAVTATAGGTFGGKVAVQVLSGDGLTVLATGPATAPGPGGTAQVSLPVSAGEAVLLKVTGGTNAANGFVLEAVNFDEFEAPQATTLFFPTQGTPTALAAADLNGDGRPDLVAANPNTADGVDVLLGNGDGTFQASRGYRAGPGGGSRALVVADLNKDKTPDVAVTDFSGASASVLLGNGDGTLQPARPFDAMFQPGAVAVGDFNGDGAPDLAVLQKFSDVGTAEQLAILIGRGDGTYLPPTYLTTSFTGGGGSLLVADFNGDGKDDLAAFSFNDPGVDLFLGNGDGTFQPARHFQTAENTATALAADVNGDGRPDLLTTGTVDAVVNVLFNNGDGTFAAPRTFLANPDPHGVAQAINGLAVTDVTGAAGGGPDGHPDLVVTAQPRNGTDAPRLIARPGLVDAQGHFAGFGAPQQLAVGPFVGPLTVGDFNGDGAPDVAAAVTGGVEVLYGQPLTLTPNTTRATARDLGTAVHYVGPAQAIVPGRQDAWYKLTVPTEAAHGAGSEILDFSAAFAALAGSGLSMEVQDAAGNVLATGARFRVLAAQGQELFLHIFGAGGSGSGVYTLDVDVLPQVISAQVQAQALLPDGPTTSLVLTLQGDRLDPATAAVPTNYRVTWLGPDGLPGTADDQVIPLEAGSAGSPPVLYDPGANVDISTGAKYPTAVRQTVTLEFNQPLPAGAYEIDLSDAIQTAAFTAGEAGLLAGDNSLTDAGAFAGHPLASQPGGQPANGSALVVNGLVPAPGGVGDLAVFSQGTPFLGQLHDDLGAVLADALSGAGDTASTPAVSQEILDRVGPGFENAGQRPAGLVVVWLDPVSVNLADPAGDRVRYDLQQGTLTNTISNAFVSVAGNIEVLVFPTSGGTYHLDLRDLSLPANPRGGVVVFDPNGAQVSGPTALLPGLRSPSVLSVPLTDAIRSGLSSFIITVGLAPSDTTATAPGAASLAGDAATAAPAATGVAANGIDLGAVLGSLTTGVVVDAPHTEVAAATAAQQGPAPSPGSAAGGRAGVVVSIDSGQGTATTDVGRVLQGVLGSLAPFWSGGGGAGWRRAAGGLGGLLDGSLAALRAALRPFGLPDLPVVGVSWERVWNVARGVVLDTMREIRAGLPLAPPGVTDPAAPAPAAPDRAAPGVTPNQGALPPTEGPQSVGGLTAGKASLAAALFALGLARPWVRDWLAARRPGGPKRRRTLAPGNTKDVGGNLR